MSPPPLPSPTQKGGGRNVLLVVGIIIAAAVAASLGGEESNNSAATNTLGASSRASSVNAMSRPSVAPAGSTVRDGKFQFQVLTLTRSAVAGRPDNRFMQETAQGEFVILEVGVANIGNEPQNYFGSNQKLLDTAGREYAANSSVDMYMNGYVGDINPGNGIRVVMAFDVPVGTDVQALEVHDSMFSDGVRVALEAPPGG